MGHLLDALEHAYRALGLQDAAGGDEVFGQLVPGRVIESASKLDSLRVLEEAGGQRAVVPDRLCRLSASAKDSWRQRLPAPAMLPMIEAFMAAHQLPTSRSSRTRALSARRARRPSRRPACRSSSACVSRRPCIVGQWRREHPGQDIPDGRVFTQRWPARPASKRREQVICYQYEADRARGIDKTS